MFTDTAMDTFLDAGVHAEVLDFPGVIPWGTDLQEARRLLAGALEDMAETRIHSHAPQPATWHSLAIVTSLNMLGDARAALDSLGGERWGDVEPRVYPGIMGRYRPARGCWRVGPRRS